MACKLYGTVKSGAEYKTFFWKSNRFRLTFRFLFADMKSNNYEVVEAGEKIIFRGIVQRSASQAFFLVFCTAIAFASLALVLQIQFQDVGR